MMRQGLAPGMQHHRHADPGAEMLFIGSDGAQCLGCHLEQDRIDNRFVLIRNRSDRGRQREHNMEVLHRQQIGLARIEPLLRGAGLMWWTAPAPGIESAIG